MALLYSVTAQVEIKSLTPNAGSVSRQVPAFILNANAQGILDARHAQEIAVNIINPANDPNVTVHATAVPWIETDNIPLPNPDHKTTYQHAANRLAQALERLESADRELRAVAQALDHTPYKALQHPTEQLDRLRADLAAQQQTLREWGGGRTPAKGW